MLPFLTPGKSLPFGKKRAENACVCVLVLRGKQSLVKIQSEEVFLRWFGTWKDLHARSKALPPFSASFSHFHLCFLWPGSYVLSQRRLSMMVWQPFTSKSPVAPNPSCWADSPSGSGAALFLRALPWTKTRVPPELHTVNSLPGLFLMYLPGGTKALLKTDPNPSQVIQVTLYYLGAFWCGLCH